MIAIASSFAVDRSKFLERVDRKRDRILALTGGFGRKAVMRKIRAAPKTKAGQRRARLRGGPPRNQTGLLKGNIGFNVDSRDESVIYGPIKLKYGGDRFLRGNVESVPELLEKGGSQTVMFNQHPVMAKYRARPYVSITLEATTNKLQQNIKRIGLV